jgi:type IX secretion system PorP/SprF family membrane protein
MKNIVSILSIWVLLTSFSAGLKAQDPQFSQFFNSSLYYNPATAGITQDLRFSSSYRNLWKNVPGDLSTYFIALDYQWSKKNMGIGFLMLNDNEGIHQLRTQRFELIYSYRIQSENKMLQFGMSIFSVNTRAIKNDDFVFTDQLDPMYGNVEESAFVNDRLETRVYPDWNVGLVYKHNFRHRMATQTFGFSASHIFRPDISLMNNEVRLPVKYVVHSSLLTRITFNRNIIWKRKYLFLNPGFVYEYQDNYQTFSLGSYFSAYPLRFGMWFRNRGLVTEDLRLNSIILHAGFIVPLTLNHNLMIDYTYDATVSKLEFASGGAHEITLIYNISLPDRKGPGDCPFKEWWRLGMGLQHFVKK